MVIEHDSSLLTLLNRGSQNDSVKLYLDLTNVVPSFYALAQTFVAFGRAFEANKESMGESLLRPRLASLFALSIEPPVYGSFRVQYKDSTVCGLLIVTAFAHSLLISALVLNSESHSGVKHRDRAAGVTKMEAAMTVLLFDLVLSVLSIGTQLIAVYIIYDNFVPKRLFEAGLLMLLTTGQGAIIGIIFALCVKDKVLISVR